MIIILLKVLQPKVVFFFPNSALDLHVKQHQIKMRMLLVQNNRSYLGKILAQNNHMLAYLGQILTVANGAI